MTHCLLMQAVGFLVGEKVEGSSFLFDARVSGPAITHLSQVPTPFWIILVLVIAFSERTRAEIGWVAPDDVPVSKPGLLRDTYVPGDHGFDIPCICRLVFFCYLNIHFSFGVAIIFPHATDVLTVTP